MSYGIWGAAFFGDRAEAQRLVGQDPGLLNARNFSGRTPMMVASLEGRVGVVLLLLDKGAAINVRDASGWTALYLACFKGHHPMVRLLLERGADPTIADQWGTIPLITASSQGHLEVVRSLLGRPSGKATLNHRSRRGETALWQACMYGRGGVVRALLESGADPTIASDNGDTPMAVAKLDGVIPKGATAEGRRECVAALEVR
jgi:uncharacterized protein